MSAGIPDGFEPLGMGGGFIAAAVPQALVA